MRAQKLVAACVLTLALAGCHGSRCPRGTAPNGREMFGQWEQWCERPAGDHVVWEGPYRSWYHDGSLQMEGEFKDGQPVGRWQSWYESGVLHHDAEMPDGIRHTYHQNGRPADVKQFADNGQKAVGHWQEWYEDGTLKADEWYPDGWSIDWHPNGVRHVEGALKDGQREGVWYLYTPGGYVAGFGNFETGKENGLFFNLARENDDRPLGTPMLGRVMVDGSQLGLVDQKELPAVYKDCETNGLAACCDNYPACKRWKPRMTHALEAPQVPPKPQPAAAARGGAG